MPVSDPMKTKRYFKKVTLRLIVPVERWRGGEVERWRVAQADDLTGARRYGKICQRCQMKRAEFVRRAIVEKMARDTDRI